MADCSLDDYIKQKGISSNFKKRTPPGTTTNAAGTRIKIMSPNGKKPFVKKPITAPSSAKPAQRFEARQWLSTPTAKNFGTTPQKVGIASRLGSAPSANLRTAPRIGGAPVPSLIPGPQSGLSDARQKILARTKFADARQRIVNKKLEKEGTAASVPGLFDIRQKIEAKRGFPVPPLFPTSIQHSPVSLFAPLETQQPRFAWGGGPAAAPLSANQQGVMSFGGNIVKTVNYSTPIMPGPPQPLMGNSGEPHMPNAQILQNNSKLLITMKNDQRASCIVSTQKSFQQNVPGLSMNSRINFGKVIEQQPIQTVVSQPPVKVVNQPLTPVSTQPRLTTAAAAAAKQSEVVELASPLQGYRIQVLNLHPNVSHEDITELFGAVGALKRARLVKVGHAEVVYVNREDAVAAVAKYHMRELDGVPMNLVLEDGKRAQATPLSDLQQYQPLKLNKTTVPTQVVELDPNILHKALFKTPSDQQAPVKPVSFTVHM